MPSPFYENMPAGFQPMVNIETIIITNCAKLINFPGPNRLPNLKVLVITTSSSLRVTFEIAAAIVLGLDSLHLLGDPLCPCGEDMVDLVAASSALGRRGLVLGGATGERLNGHSRGCIYLRPIGTPELSIEESGAKVEQLVQCRCGACFDCLQRAGCIEG